jgi:hypothetical protein
MAGETIIQPSSSWVTLQAAASTADGAMCAGAVTAISATTLTANEQKYPLIDFRAVVTVAPPSANTSIDIYRRSSDGTNQQPVPAADYLQQYVGSAMLDDATGSYYLWGVQNVDPAATFYAFNNSGTTVTIQLVGRTRGWNTAA